jgi:hypothetical protein
MVGNHWLVVGKPLRVLMLFLVFDRQIYSVFGRCRQKKVRSIRATHLF